MHCTRDEGERSLVGDLMEFIRISRIALALSVFPQPPLRKAGFPTPDQICAAARHGIALFRGTLARRHGAIFLPPLLPFLSPPRFIRQLNARGLRGASPVPRPPYRSDPSVDIYYVTSLLLLMHSPRRCGVYADDSNAALRAR